MTTNYKPKFFDEILQDMVDFAVSKTDKITDFNEGSTNRAILSAVALAIEDNYFEIMLAWVSAMRTALQDSLEFNKKTGVKATLNVIFSRPTVATQNYPINIGTIVATGDGVRFVTTQSGSILIGNTDSGLISVEAEKVGIDGNVGIDKVTVLVSKPAGVETVTNPAGTDNGVNEETDEAYNARFQKYLQGLTKTTPAGQESGAESVEGVHEARLIETTAPGILRLYIDDGSGGASQAVLDAVENKIENEDYRASGTIISYLSANKVTTNTDIEVFYDKKEDPDTLEPIVEQNIIDYINNIKIGEDLIVNELRKTIMNTSGVRDVIITTPASNVPAILSDGEIIKYGTGVIVMTLYQDLT
jgi:uncharacterized phage protein gp47/JayE